MMVLFLQRGRYPGRLKPASFASVIIRHIFQAGKPPGCERGQWLSYFLSLYFAASHMVNQLCIGLCPRSVRKEEEGNGETPYAVLCSANTAAAL